MKTATRPYDSSRRRRHEPNTRVNHSLVGGIEVIDAKEQTDAASELLAHTVRLVLAVGTREQNTGLASIGTNHNPALRPTVVRQRQHVLNQLKLQHVKRRTEWAAS